MDYDAIIVGSGHNGLVAAFYLARAGLSVLLAEARDTIGGSCVTEELIPGFRFSTCANVVWALRPKLIADMRLYQRGLTVDQRQFLRLLPGGDYMHTGRLSSAAPGEDAANLDREIAKFSRADARAFPAWQEFLARITRILGPYLLQPPPRLHQIYAALADPADRQALDLVLINSLAALADRFFESEIMRDVGAAADIGDIHDVGTGLLFALTTAMGAYSENELAVPNGYVRGGMGQITALMAEAAREQGVAIRTGAPVARILVEGRQARGVELVSGEHIAARLVISNLDPKRTFLRLTDVEQLDQRFLRRVRALQTHVAAGLKLHCALAEAPEYGVRGGLSERQLRESTLIVAPGRAYREAAWRAASQGELPDQPIIAGFMPSVYDPSLAPPGRYTWSAYITWAPARLREGTWETRREEIADRLLAAIERYAPNFRRALLDYLLLTPADLEARMHLTDGNIHHVDAIPSQLLWQRPLEELAQYRTPIERLYLCGAGTHPWGEVSGAPGHNAAQAVLSDLEHTPLSTRGV
jgi:phytoene dehydrogenase-like protein